MSDRRKRLLYRFLAIAVVALVAITFLKIKKKASGPSTLPQIRTWAPSLADQEHQTKLDRSSIKAFVDDGRDASFLRALSSFHLVEIETNANPKLVTYTQASERHRVTVERYVRDFGISRYVQLGLVLRAQFDDALSSVISLAQKEKLTLSGIAAHHPEHDGVSALRNLGGNFVDWAVQQGLIFEDGQAKSEHRFLVGLLFKLRWLTWAKELDPVDAHLTPLEKRTILAYRVEVHPNIPLKRRLTLLHELKAVDPSYPAYTMELITLIKDGRADLARSRMQTALREAQSAGQQDEVRLLEQIDRFLDSLPSPGAAGASP